MNIIQLNADLIPYGRCLVALLARVGNLRSYAAQSVLSPQHTPENSGAGFKRYSNAKQPDQQAVALWQQVAGLTADQAQQLLQDQPKLGNFLQPGYDSSTLAQNLHLLRCHGAGIRSGAGIPTKLRAYLAVAPHQALEQAKQVERLIAGQAMDQKQHDEQQYEVIMQQLTAHMEVLVAHAAHRLRKPAHQPLVPGATAAPLQQPPMQQHNDIQSLRQHLQQYSQQQVQMEKLQIPDLIQLLGKSKTQYLRSLLPPLPQLQHLDEQLLLTAAAILKALQLPYTEHLPADLRPKRLPELSSATAHSDVCTQGGSAAETATTSSSSSRGSKRRPRRNNTKSSSSSTPDHSMFTALCSILSSAVRRIDLKNKPLPKETSAAKLASQLWQHLGGLEALKLLLARPTLLWLQDSPSRVLVQLQQQLPSLNLRQLLLSAPGVLLVPPSQVAEMVTLLTGRLALSREQAASVVQHHPQLLQSTANSASMNLGFLIGLGLRPNELQAMLLKSPGWLTRPLKDLTVQWQFVTTVAKASQSDVVMLPDLLSLPISRLAPRILYARKRQVKLLLPSHAAMLPALSPSEWLKHKLVPLQFWITTSEKRMCEAVALDADDYSRFKAAWVRVDAFSWSQAAADSKNK